MRPAIALACLVVTLSASWRPAAADWVVLEAINSRDHTPGDIVRSGQALHLERGERVVLVGVDGSKSMVIGPYQGTLSAPAPAADGAVLPIEAMARLIAASDYVAQLNALPRTRGQARPAVPPPSAVNVAAAGDQCIPERSQPTLWRPRAGAEARLEIASPALGQGAVVAWPAGRDTIHWPLDIKLADNTEYRFHLTGADPVAVTLHRMPADLPSRAHQAAWMKEHDCEQQAVLLLVTAKIDLFIDELAAEGKF